MKRVQESHLQLLHLTVLCMVLKYVMACTGNAESTFWQAVKVKRYYYNVPLAQTVIPGVKRRAKCFFTSNSSRSEMSKTNF